MATKQSIFKFLVTKKWKTSLKLKWMEIQHEQPKQNPDFPIPNPTIPALHKINNYKFIHNQIAQKSQKIQEGTN